MVWGAGPPCRPGRPARFFFRGAPSGAPRPDPYGPRRRSPIPIPSSFIAVSHCSTSQYVIGGIPISLDISLDVYCIYHWAYFSRFRPRPFPSNFNSVHYHSFVCHSFVYKPTIQSQSQLQVFADRS